MNWNALQFFPVMGEALTENNTLKLDFSPANSELDLIDLGNTEEFNSYVFGQLSGQNKKYGIGGYFEHRAIYRRSEVFATQESDFRNIHLGVDIWAEAGKSVFAPMDGIIHSFQDNAGFGNYGPTIILEHYIDGQKLYSLYGHLFLSDLEKLKVGQEMKAGDLLCHIGPFPENGDWPPHLHFQLMLDMLGNVGDFPGVCSQREIEKYKAICPDPNLILVCPLI
ncbi:peptidoglycan DD-metalloendopeptidase family protein [Algoriphagus pacificus]|uniref:Peptidoglycan DD-metalloendopeptidase family protein n=1 Tax=Algoriphagus pacificus TaxID=2811234 RepID=A0ABS3CGJ0_9BACT|nr:peptidoglycan DD-metalloendopeptidase family protein [Algoriphagus pacificus]MBN7814764.1 peptidoglycan DD-metalloendopeptidase family protein [Algoriphagus pacificus]